ncbi:hypothetical protein BKA66DRAFT_120318 [Pyrenochaeta sp. MPI-SDFR-AT-0127]|nr:hypothetical protein BKA66DRAFT_120318 [Pyrenochaeta sp. MPI-SDFR-AT-0127]
MLLHETQYYFLEGTYTKKTPNRQLSKSVDRALYNESRDRPVRTTPPRQAGKQPQTPKSNRTAIRATPRQHDFLQSITQSALPQLHMQQSEQCPAPYPSPLARQYICILQATGYRPGSCMQPTPVPTTQMGPSQQRSDASSGVSALQVAQGVC